MKFSTRDARNLYFWLSDEFISRHSESDFGSLCSIHVVRSNNISIHHVSILGDFDTPNNDGIDIDSSNNTSIYSCNIDTGDDAICPKTNDGPVHNLTVSRCWIRTKSCGVKLGSASTSDFYGLRFNWINITESHRGIGLQLRDSGNIYDVIFSNFNIMTRYYDQSWWGRAEPIYVTSCPRSPATVVGSIYNLQRFTNYTGGLLDYRPGCQGLVDHQNSEIAPATIPESIEFVDFSLFYQTSLG
ncbi:hypothetical protein GOP47_0008428 [Adiantum capillus-veneris]|uniref:Polygalacturonase n=1 Tax=Adiantum capillus-veneris TaxID=13818 RepID=A0A9D4UYJ9_ADICA|nr:hypothetical protein GOP47_0008428 [Adiantum capillus-veneris]